MLELGWIAETLRVWFEGGDVNTAFGFKALVALAAFVIGPSVLAVATGSSRWHETWAGRWFGLKAPAPDDWTDRARDIDGDGVRDF